MKIFRDLKVKLTDAEWRAYVDEWAREQAKSHETLARKAEVMADFKSKIEAHENAERDLGEKVRSREETRAVECFEKHDGERFVVELYRADTGELVSTRPMSAAERHDALQAVLPLVSRTPPEPQGN